MIDRDNIPMTDEEYSLLIIMSGKTVSRYDIVTRTIYTLHNPEGIYTLPPVIENFPESILDSGVVAPECEEGFLRYYNDMRNGIKNGANDFFIPTEGGKRKWMHSEYMLLADEDGKYSTSIITVEDVTDRYEQRTANQRHHLEIEALTGDCAFYLEGSLTHWRIDTVSGTISEQLPQPGSMGFSCDVFFGEATSRIVHPDDVELLKEFTDRDRLMLLNSKNTTSDSMEYRIIRDGKPVWYRISIFLINPESGNDVRFYAVFHDIDDERTEQENLRMLATTDMMTGLLVRSATMQGIDDYLAGEGAELSHALVILDLDGLKLINDTLGHQTGDKAICRMASAMRRCFRSSDILGRVGGDEFFVFLKNATPSVVARKIRELQREMQFFCTSGKNRILVSCSAGISLYDGSSEVKKTRQQMYTEADAALYRTKALGKNSYTFFTEEKQIPTNNVVLTTAGKDEEFLRDQRRILNRFACGIEIFHGTSPDSIQTVFCNDSMLEMVGLTLEQHASLMHQDNYFGIHPDDTERFHSIFKAAYDEHTDFKSTHRLRTASGEYRRVTALGSIHFLDDGSFDVYVTYSDA